MQKIETLKNKSGESIYPLTSTKAVVDENGNTIEDRLVVADGEDLVTDGNVLRLKDRPSTDGMGYVILRKDKTFQEQVTKPNTIYEIRYDFDLNGAEVTIPEGCVLKFEGGSLRGGTVVGNHTIIQSDAYNIFNGVHLSSVIGYSAYPEWYGAKGNNINDDTNAIQACVNTFNKVNLTPGKIYRCNGTIKLPIHSELIGNLSAKITTSGEKDLLYVSQGCIITQLYVLCDKPCNVFNITTEYIKESYISHPLYRMEVPPKISITACRVHTSVTAEFVENSKCFNFIANDKGKGTSYIYVADCFVSGRWDYGVCINSKKEGTTLDWITDVTFSSVQFNAYVKKGFYIGRQDKAPGYNRAPTRVIIENSSQQYDEHYSDYFIFIEHGDSISVKDCRAWDFPYGTSIHVNPNNIINVSVINTLISARDRIVYTEAARSEYADVTVLNQTHSNVISSQGLLSDLLNAADDAGNIIRTKPITKREVVAIPSGIYSLSVAYNWQLILNLPNNMTMNGGFVKVSKIYGGYTMLEYYINNTNPNTKYVNLAVYLYSFVRYNESDLDAPITWSYSSPKEYLSPTDMINTADINGVRGFINNTAVRYKYGRIVDYNGYTYSANSGKNRPAGLTESDAGKPYFDTDLGKPVVWNGTEWIEADGSSAGIKRAGTWSQRPNADGSFLDNGFQYFLLESEPDEDPDGNPMESITGNGKPIWWIQDSGKWVDATGATVTG